MIWLQASRFGASVVAIYSAIEWHKAIVWADKPDYAAGAYHHQVFVVMLVTIYMFWNKIERLKDRRDPKPSRWQRERGVK
jgi:hypothetical protein